MAIVSGYTINREQFRRLKEHADECAADYGAPNFDMHCQDADGRVSIACVECETIVIEFYPEEE